MTPYMRYINWVVAQQDAGKTLQRKLCKHCGFAYKVPWGGRRKCPYCK